MPWLEAHESVRSNPNSEVTSSSKPANCHPPSISTMRVLLYIFMLVSILIFLELGWKYSKRINLSKELYIVTLYIGLGCIDLVTHATGLLGLCILSKLLLGFYIIYTLFKMMSFIAIFLFFFVYHSYYSIAFMVAFYVHHIVFTIVLLVFVHKATHRSTYVTLQNNPSQPPPSPPPPSSAKVVVQSPPELKTSSSSSSSSSKDIVIKVHHQGHSTPIVKIKHFPVLPQSAGAPQSSCRSDLLSDAFHHRFHLVMRPSPPPGAVVGGGLSGLVSQVYNNPEGVVTNGMLGGQSDEEEEETRFVSSMSCNSLLVPPGGVPANEVLEKSFDSSELYEQCEGVRCPGSLNMSSTVKSGNEKSVKI